MATVAEVARKEIDGFLAKIAQSGRIFPCIDGEKRHKWVWEEVNEFPTMQKRCKKCTKWYKRPLFIGYKERAAISARIDQLRAIVASELSKEASREH